MGSKHQNLPKLFCKNEIYPNYLGSMKFVRDICYHFNFPKIFGKIVETEFNLLKISYFVKKVILNINLIKIADAKVKIIENAKKV